MVKIYPQTYLKPLRKNFDGLKKQLREIMNAKVDF